MARHWFCSCDDLSNCFYDSEEDSRCGSEFFYSGAADDDNTTEVIDPFRSGVVVAVLPKRRYGFIAVDKERFGRTYSKAVYVHFSDVWRGSLRKGEKVEFDVARGNQKRHRAVNVRPAAQEPDQDQPLGATASSTGSETELDTTYRQGTVVKYNAYKRFGIVKCFDTNDTFLAFHKELRPPLTALRVGQVVEFEVITGPKGRPAACDVEVIIDASDPVEYNPDGGQWAEAEEEEEEEEQEEEEDEEEQDDQRAEKGARAAPPVATPQEDLATALSEEFTCIICFELLATDSVQTPCEHYFCRQCIRRWLNGKPSCPTCKSRVVRGQLEPIPRGIKNLIERTRTSERR